MGKSSDIWRMGGVTDKGTSFSAILLKATHTDIGLHNSQYIQRHGTVKSIEEAARLIDEDTRADDDPAAYRYVMEGAWFWENYPMDRGEEAARRIVRDYIARGRMGVGATCAGNHTHLFSVTEIERSVLTRRRLADRWGIDTHTFIMADNPGRSSGPSAGSTNPSSASSGISATRFRPCEAR